MDRNRDLERRVVVLEDMIDLALHYLSDPENQAEPELPERLREILTRRL